MKRFVLAAIAVIFSFGTVFGQNDLAPSGSQKRTPEQRAEAFTKKMTKNLSLDDAQQQRVKAINLDRFKQIEEARAAGKVERKGVGAKIKAINENYVSTLKGILTEEQFKKFEEMKQEIMEKTMRRKEGK